MTHLTTSTTVPAWIDHIQSSGRYTFTREEAVGATGNADTARHFPTSACPGPRRARFAIAWRSPTTPVRPKSCSNRWRSCVVSPPRFRPEASTRFGPMAPWPRSPGTAFNSPDWVFQSATRPGLTRLSMRPAAKNRLALPIDNHGPSSWREFSGSPAPQVGSSTLIFVQSRKIIAMSAAAQWKP